MLDLGSDISTIRRELENPVPDDESTRYIRKLDIHERFGYSCFWRGTQEVASLGWEPENPEPDMETDSCGLIGGCGVDAS